MSRDLFGTSISETGFDTIGAAFSEACKYVSPSAARMLALFKYRPFLNFLNEWRDASGIDSDEIMCKFSSRHHACIESLARGKRKAVEVYMNEYRKKGIVRGQWLAAYESTEHWRKVKELAKDAFENCCQMCSATDDIQWHHKTYKRVGTEYEYLDIVPVCDDCHLAVHAMHDICKRTDFNCGTLTDIVRSILASEGVTIH